MTDYVETQTNDGATIRIEVEPSSKIAAGFGRASASTEDANKSPNTYNQILSTIRACANGVIDTLQNLEALPNAASINFAIKVDAEAGPMIAKSMNDAQFKVALTWKQVETGSGEGKEEEENK